MDAAVTSVAMAALVADGILAGLSLDKVIVQLPARRRIIGGRIYFDLTTPADIPHHWWGVFAVWSGGLGIWGGSRRLRVVGAWRVRRCGADVRLFMDAVAPALLVAQAIGRIGNYFNQELFGRPTSLPWGAADRARSSGPPATPSTRPSSRPSSTS